MADKSVSTESLAMEVKQEYTGKKLRVAIIGCGGIAQTHLGIFQKLPEVEIVAGCDIDPRRLEIMKDKWGVSQLYADWKEMLRKVKPDAVDVCTPNGVHAPAAIDASKSGAHVLVEKPMAMTPKQCQQMIDAAKGAGKKLCIGFQYRYHPNTQYVVRNRDEGRLGKIMIAKITAMRRRGIPNWGVFGQKEMQGGGPMIDIGVHAIEMTHYAMGRPKPVAATGMTWTYLGNKKEKTSVVSQWPNWDYKTYTVEDLAIGQVRMEDGAIMQIEASFAAHIPHDTWGFQLIGDKGGVRWDPPGLFTDTANTLVNEAPGYMPQEGSFGGLFHQKLKNWVDACVKGTPLTAPGEDGLVVQKIIDGVYRSAEKGGKEVTID
jgi:predicted dehydrogenase